MATITIKDLPNDPNALVIVQIDAHNIIELYLPKQVADLLTSLNSLNITARLNPDRVIAGA